MELFGGLSVNASLIFLFMSNIGKSGVGSAIAVYIRRKNLLADLIKWCNM